jgi:hypothetical protein
VSTSTGTQASTAIARVRACLVTASDNSIDASLRTSDGEIRPLVVGAGERIA